jgi:hypothetical protein
VLTSETQMLKHSGMLEMQETANLTHPLTEAQYKLWVNQESRNRYGLALPPM